MQTLEKLYKVDSQGRLREWTMHIDGNSFYAVKGLVGMKLTQDKPTTSTAKNIGRSNETTDAEQAVAEAVAHPADRCASEVLQQILLKLSSKVFRQVFALHLAQHTVEQCPFHLNLHLLRMGLHHCNPDQ